MPEWLAIALSVTALAVIVGTVYILLSHAGYVS